MGVEFKGNLVSIDRSKNKIVIHVSADTESEHVLTISAPDGLLFKDSFIIPILRNCMMMSPSEIDSTPTIDQGSVKRHKITIVVD